jgi:hypothetical protein
MDILRLFVIYRDFHVLQSILRQLLSTIPKCNLSYEILKTYHCWQSTPPPASNEFSPSERFDENQDSVGGLSVGKLIYR